MMTNTRTLTKKGSGFLAIHVAALFAWTQEHRPSLLFCGCGLVTGFSTLLGGGTRPGFLSDAILQLLAVPVLLLVIVSLYDLLQSNLPARGPSKWPILLCLAIVGVPILQLLPLPLWIWIHLPGRERVAGVYDLLSVARPWLPISVSPNATWLSLLSLLPPLAVFLGTIQLDYTERRRLSLIIIALGIVSAFLGLMQVAQGPTSSLRFFVYTNPTEAVGFFANRNHFAALLYVILLFALAWSIDVAFKAGSSKDAKSLTPAAVFALAASFVVLIVLIAAEGMARSRAGLSLTMIALAAGFAMAFPDRLNSSEFRIGQAAPRKVLFVALVVAVTLVLQFGLYRISQRFDSDLGENTRLDIALDTLRAAWSFFPFGSGMGTFVAVYAMFEQPKYLLIDAYANHAHDDFLELWLETGVVGVAIILAFAAWFSRRVLVLWKTFPVGGQKIDLFLVRAATIAIALLVVHSVFDYPLRTGAMMAIFAFSCALLVEPPRNAERQTGMGSATAGRAVALSQAVSAPPLSVEAAHLRPETEPPSRLRPQFGGRWGEDIEWPEAWKKTNE